MPANLPAPVPALPDFIDLTPLPGVPLVPEPLLRSHAVFVPTDQRFRAAARLLQALWREDRDLPIGTYVDADGKRRRLGSRITQGAARAGQNFLSNDIAHFVRRELVYREIGALIEEERLLGNLLSSAPLTFNLFAPLKGDLRLATRFIQELFPEIVKEVVAIRFEHAPRRGDVKFTGDYTAFDLAFFGISPTGARVFIGVEIKFTESGWEPLPSRFSDRHFAIASNSGLFVDPEAQALYRNPLQQLLRELCLAQTILDNGLADDAHLLFIAPTDNHLAQGLAASFRGHLASPAVGKAGFSSITLERVTEALALIGLVDHAKALHRRYCDWHQIDGELELLFSDQASTAVADKRGSAIS